MSDRDIDQQRIQRLAALSRYNILDTPPEPEFDEITRIACYVCDSPIALISLVERDRQWFKSETGLGVCETPIGASVCATAMHLGDVTVVPDLAADPRFSANLLVNGPPHIRFYAGASLATPEGVPIGMVCVIDHQTRPEGLTENQRLTLRALARQTMAHLELRRFAAERDIVSKELSHRVKNVFSLVGSIASLSARKFPEAKAYAADFTARIQALSRAHDLVLKRESLGAAVAPQKLQDILARLLSPFLVESVEHWTISGPDLEVGPFAAETLVLFPHEMATNLAKYGALSAPGGRVAIDWRLDGDALELVWTDSGGPRVVEPATLGFGSRLIQQAADSLGGTITREWHATGLIARLRAPLANL